VPYLVRSIDLNWANLVHTLMPLDSGFPSTGSARSLVACFAPGRAAIWCGPTRKARPGQPGREAPVPALVCRRQIVPGAGLTPRDARPARVGICRWRCGDLWARRSAWAWSVRGPGGTGPWPVPPRRSASWAWPPGRGGSCLRERRCSSEVTTALPRMPIAAHTAAKARTSARGAQDS
jgi:hypothetical protein